MKRFIIFIAFIAALIISPAHSNAATINVISQGCYVSGYTASNESDYVPVAASDTTAAYLDAVWTTGSATIDVRQSTALLTADNTNGMFLYGQSNTSLSFSPSEASYIQILATVYTHAAGEVYLYVTLSDTTTNELLFNLSSLYFSQYSLYQKFPGLIPNGEYNLWGQTVYSYDDFNPLSTGLIPVDSSHIYNLSVDVGNSCDYVFAYADLSLVPVPEPATILLLGLGLIGLACVRKKIKN